MQLLEEARFGPARLGKRLGPDGLAWTRVGDTEDNLSSTFVGQRHAVLE